MEGTKKKKGLDEGFGLSPQKTNKVWSTSCLQMLTHCGRKRNVMGLMEDLGPKKDLKWNAHLELQYHHSHAYFGMENDNSYHIYIVLNDAKPGVSCLSEMGQSDVLGKWLTACILKTRLSSNLGCDIF